MDNPHKQLVTTYPVALKFGQGKVHVQNERPWHHKSELFKCPKSETVFIVTEDFPNAKLVEALEAQHKNQETHPDYIASEPTLTRIAECSYNA